VYDAAADTVEISWEYITELVDSPPETVLVIRRAGEKALSNTFVYTDTKRYYFSNGETNFIETVATGLNKDISYWYTFFWSMDVMTEAETTTINMNGPLDEAVRLFQNEQTVIFSPIVDGWVNSIGQKDFSGIYLKANVYTYTEISLLKFDINFQCLDIISSYLKLNVSNMDSMYSRNFNLNRILLDWTKTDLNLYSNFGNSEMYVDTLTSSFNIPMGMTGYYSADVTGIVEDWFQSSANYGFRLRQSSNMSDTDFFSSRSANNNEWPELEIKYNGYVLDNDF